MKKKSLDQVIESLQICNRRESIYLYLPLCLLVSFGEIYIIDQFWQKQIALPVAALLHVLILLLCVGGFLVLNYFNFDVRLTTAMIVLTLFLGPLGALTSLAIGGFYLLYRRLSSPFSALLEQLFPEEHQGHPIANLAMRIRRGLENVDTDTTATPFLDIMTFGSLTQRLRAVSLMLRYFHPRLGSVLQLGLRDPNNSVRVLAATSLVALEKHYYDEYLSLEAEVEKNPRSRLNWLALAKHAEDYAKSKILSSERETKMLKVALKAYASYALLDDRSDKSMISIARVQLCLGEIESAKKLLQEIVDKGSTDAAALKLLDEALFRSGDYSGLRQRATQVPSHLTGNDMDQEILAHLSKLWASDGQVNLYA